MNFNQIKLLIDLKNRALIGKETLIINYNFSCLKLLSFLYLEGIIQSFFIEEEKITIILRFYEGLSRLRSLKLSSYKSSVKALSHKEICKIRADKTTIVFSTDKGFLNLVSCKRKNIGGKILFVC
jgi:ribosomal protein S8